MILMPGNIIYLKSLSTNGRLVLAALVSFQNTFKSENFISNERVSSDLGISMPTLKRVYSELTKRKFIIRTRRLEGRTRLTNVNEGQVLAGLKEDMGDDRFWSMFKSRNSIILQQYPELDTSRAQHLLSSSGSDFEVSSIDVLTTSENHAIAAKSHPKVMHSVLSDRHASFKSNKLSIKSSATDIGPELAAVLDRAHNSRPALPAPLADD